MMHKLIISLLLAVFVHLSSISIGHLAYGAPAFQVIVNAQNQIDQLDRKFLAAIFFKKVTHWPGDGVISPIDLGLDSPVRFTFSEEVMGRSVLGIKNYWQQLIFSGQDIPPPELVTEEEVVQFVMNNPSSIGYISSKFLAENENLKGIRIVSIR